MKNNQIIIDSVKQELSKSGYEISLVPITRLEDLKNDVENFKRSEFFTEIVSAFVKTFYNFNLPDAPFRINSIILVASPSPLVKVIFGWKKKKVSIMIPPTYMDYDVKPPVIEACLNQIMNRYGLHVSGSLALPLKLLGIRSGLSRYGRNNISYIEGMGSFAFLSAHYSDVQCEDNWHDIQQMDSCKNCKICINKCPTGAIEQGRFPVRVERCITHYNENVGDFPQWMNPAWHNSIVGCLSCQLECPANRQYPDNFKTVEFNKEETALLLKGGPLVDLPDSLADKIKVLNMTSYFNVLPRNLKVLLDKET